MASSGIFSDVIIMIMVTMEALGTAGIARADTADNTLEERKEIIKCYWFFIHNVRTTIFTFFIELFNLIVLYLYDEHENSVGT